MAKAKMNAKIMVWIAKKLIKRSEWKFSKSAIKNFLNKVYKKKLSVAKSIDNSPN